MKFDIRPSTENQIEQIKAQEQVEKSNSLSDFIFMLNKNMKISEPNVESTIKVYLSDEEKNIPLKDLGEKYGITISGASLMKKRGYRTVDNPDFTSKEKQKEEKHMEVLKFLNEITSVNINSIETVFGNKEEQEIIKEIINIYNICKFNDKDLIDKKKFKLVNGKYISFGDAILLDKIIELKMFRDDNDDLMMFDKNKKEFIKFYPTDFLSKHKSFTFRDIKKQNNVISLESFSPQLFKMGFFREEDFERHIMGTEAYEINGPHERKFSRKKPYVFLSNNDGTARYYLGKDKFTGTDKKINYETVRVSLLDNNTAAITDTINGKKVILYTFSLLNKEQYEKKKSEVLEKRILENKPTDRSYNDYIVVGGKELSSKITPYKITNYIQKNTNESNEDYTEKISQLSDTSYVLGKFRSFMSETGLAANNYLWKEQLILADALTGVGQKDKIIQLGKNFGKNGLRTFLSVEQGGKEMGDKILELGENLPKELAEKLFVKYSEIIDNIEKITEFTKSNFNKEIETNPELIKKVEETLYLKGKQLLSQTHDDFRAQKAIDFIALEKQLDRINADTITTFAIFKQAIKNGEKIPIESIEGSIFSKKEATEISKEQQNEMLELYESNWENYSDRIFVESLKSYFKTAFVPEDNKQKNYFYTFEKDLQINGKDRHIRAFVRFEKQKDTSLYASALNVDEASKNFGLGEAMMDEALVREAKENILHASCRKDNPSNMRYFEKGFISKGFKKTNETEEFDLVWNEKKNKDILSKQKTRDELIHMFNNKSFDKFEIKKSKNLLDLHKGISNGKSLVRCFLDKNNEEWYAVYEVVPEDYGTNIGDTK